MTTTCEHGRERDTCPECGVLARESAKFGEAIVLDVAGATRALTDVEEKWTRMKHPEMSKADLDEMIAAGLPADVPPITRADLPPVAKEPNPPHWYRRSEWDQKKRARKIAAASRRRNRKH